MNRAGRWFAAAVVTSFAAGLAVGLAVPRVQRLLAPPDDGPTASYVRELQRRYGLDPEQTRWVGWVLETRDKEIAGVDPRSSAGKAKVRASQLLAQERIKQVLNDEQRTRFLRDSGFMAQPARPSVADGNKTNPERSR